MWPVLTFHVKQRTEEAGWWGRCPELFTICGCDHETVDEALAHVKEVTGRYLGDPEKREERWRELCDRLPHWELWHTRPSGLPLRYAVLDDGREIVVVRDTIPFATPEFPLREQGPAQSLDDEFPPYGICNDIGCQRPARFMDLCVVHWYQTASSKQEIEDQLRRTLVEELHCYIPALLAEVGELGGNEGLVT